MDLFIYLEVTGKEEEGGRKGKREEREREKDFKQWFIHQVKVRSRELLLGHLDGDSVPAIWNNFH